MRVRSAAFFTMLSLGALQPGCEQPFVPLFNGGNVAPEAIETPTAQQVQPTGAATATAPETIPAKVSTVNVPEGPRRLLGLAECICLALENGRTGEFYDRPDSERHTSVTGLQQQAPAAGSSDSLRVFAYDPALAAAEVQQALSRFDVLWRTGLDWNRVNTPGGLQDGVPLVGPLNGEAATAQFRTELLKPLPTGGVAGITFRQDYANQMLPPGSAVLNPANVAGVELSFEQPLLQGGGILVNQVRQTFPPSVLHPIPSTAVPPEGRFAPAILLARIAREESESEFERRVHELLFAVEAAYWDLYCAYWDLYSRENGMRQAQVAWQLARQRRQAGLANDADVAQAEEQYHFFRSQRLEALGRGSGGRPGVLEAERRLRYVTGLPAEDGSRIIPIDAPTAAPLTPDWESSVQTARLRRPELVQARKEIEAMTLGLTRANDFLLPDLRFVSRYGVNGLGGSVGSSLRNVADDPFSNWQVGLQMQVPLGFRGAHAEVTRSRLLVAQRFAFLRDQEAKTALSLQRSFRDVVQFQEEMASRRSQREAAARQVRVRYQTYQAGGKEGLDLLLRAQRSWADALRDEQIAVCRYNTALADLERQKGTIMDYHNVSLVQGTLPSGAVQRASEHFRHRLPPGATAPALGPPAPDALAGPSDEPRHADLLRFLDTAEASASLAASTRPAN